MGGWMDGWMGGWVDGKAGLRIAYSNQKFMFLITLKLNFNGGQFYKKILNFDYFKKLLIFQLYKVWNRKW